MEIRIREFNFLIIGFIALIIIGGFLFLKNQATQQIHEKLLVVENGIPTQTGRTIFQRQSESLTKAVDPELVDLDSQIISCSPSVDGLLSDQPNIGGSCLGPGAVLDTVKGKYLGGQCCGVLKDTEEYHEQLEKLKQYSHIPDIPLNPYKTPVDLAKKWIDYDKNTQLTLDGQIVYDKALKLSKEGPCCCRCWHYYVNSGIAKYLIKNYNFDAKQIADFWDASDICGN